MADIFIPGSGGLNNAAFSVIVIPDFNEVIDSDCDYRLTLTDAFFDNVMGTGIANGQLIGQWVNPSTGSPIVTGGGAWTSDVNTNSFINNPDGNAPTILINDSVKSILASTGTPTIAFRLFIVGSNIEPVPDTAISSDVSVVPFCEQVHLDDGVDEGVYAANLNAIAPSAGEAAWNIQSVNNLQAIYDPLVDLNFVMPNRSDFLEDVLVSFNEGIAQSSPLVLDLDGDGVELTAFDSANASYFNLNETGFAARTGWVDVDDGLLALDWNANGKIDSSAELFGSQTVDGFSELEELDTNLDGVINSLDQNWNDLRVWQDANVDGITDDGELKTLAELGILSIDLEATAVSQTNQGHSVTHVSSYTYDTGTGTATRDIVDVWFEHDVSDTRYAEDYTLDLLTLYLPTLRGYGTLPDLFIAMSLDNDMSDSNSLLSLVHSFSELSMDDVFNDTGAIMETVKGIMFRWAGVDGVFPTSRGINIDAQQIEFLEALTGQNYFQYGYVPNPGFWAGQDLFNSFDIALQATAARLISQTVGVDLFTGDVQYNVFTDAIEDITGLNQTTLNDLSAKAADPLQTSDTLAFWKTIVLVVEGTIGVSNLSAGDLSALETAITSSDASLTLADVQAALVFTTEMGITEFGTSGDDIINGTALNDELSGGLGNDTIFGGDQHDFIFGNDGNDFIEGGEGEDVMQGGTGDDTYSFPDAPSVHWTDVIDEQSGTADKIVFGSWVAPEDVTLTRHNNIGRGPVDLVIEVDNGTDRFTIVVLNHFSSSGSIETIEFSDQSTIDLTTQEYITLGTPVGDSIRGIEFGGSNVDTIFAGDGNDGISGDAGNDTLYGEEGHDDLRGGDGDDQLFGGVGNDFMLGDDGVDTLYGEAGNDELRGGEDNDVLLGGAGNDLMSGNAGDDSLNGGTDEDTLFGNDGVDTLTGGLGDDVLDGGDGDDTYIFNYGDGDDRIKEFASATETDTVLLGPGITPEMIEYTRINNDDIKLVIDGGAGGSIILDNHTQSTGSFIENLQFDDGTTVDLTTQQYTTFGTEGDDSAINGVDLGGDENDIIFALGGDDSVRGFSGDDVIDAGAGDDLVQGDAGDDQITGGLGDDVLEGDAGSDTYFFAYGDGDDRIAEFGSSSDVDRIVFDASITQEMVAYTRVNGNDLQILIDGGLGGSITLDRPFSSTFRQVNEVEFSDGTVVDLLSLEYATIGTEGDDGISGITSAGSQNDTIFGLGGNDDIRPGVGNDTVFAGEGDDFVLDTSGADILYGEAGNDELRGGADNDTLIGGANDDELKGDAGDDTYIFNYGDGNDIINETGSVNGDTLQFGPGIVQAMLSFARIGPDMVIEVDHGLGGTITVIRQFATSTKTLETIKFDDSSEIDVFAQDYTTFGTDVFDDIRGITVGGSNNDTFFSGGGDDFLLANTGDDTLFGEAGNDSMNAEEGDDVLFGGTGADTMTGGIGADTFGFDAASIGTGVDIVTDFDLVENDKLDVSAAIQFDASSGDVITDFVEIVDNGSASTVRVDADGLANGVNFVDIATLNGINGLTDEAQLVTDATLIVEGNNLNPRVFNDAVMTDEDVAVVISPLANDTDAELDNLTITSIQSSANATVIHDGTDITYTPNANFNGTDIVVYTVDDGNGGTDTGKITVTVNPINDAPIAIDETVVTPADAAIDVDVLSNDTDVDGDVLTITSIGTAPNGTVTHDGSIATYTPNAGFNGVDSFTYTIDDGNGSMSTAAVTVEVGVINDAPIAEDDVFNGSEDVDIVGNVLVDNGNGADSDPDGDSLTVVAETIATANGGIVSLLVNGDFTYMPATNFNGVDTFNYTVEDGNGLSDTGTVTLNVAFVNDTPDAMDDAAGTQEDNAVVSNVLANDTDVDGDTLTITSVTNGANGTVTHDGTSTTYTPNLNFNGADSFTYTISDGNGGTDTATVNVTVVSVNDFPLSVGDAVSTDEDTLVIVDVLANDSDADGDPLSITAVGTATNGTVTHDGAFVTYTPNANFNGADSFTYTISDGNDGSDTAIVDVVVNAINDDPDAVADSVTTDEDTSVVVDVRANDTDLDGDTLTITSAGVAANGTVTHDGVNVTYTPNANFNGADSFTYTISDGSGGVDTATVNVTVNAVNDNPVAVDDSATTDEDVAAVIDVLTNDSDVDGDTLSISAVTNGTNGTVTHDGTNVTYTPNTGFFGADSFSYTVSDGNGGTESATVNVTVNEVGGNNNSPVAVDDNVSVNEDEVLNSNVLTNDTDADGDTLSATPANITTAGGGSVVLNSDGSFTYTPVAGFNGPDTFDYTMIDGNGGSDVGTVSITVNAVNDLPAPQDDEFDMDYGTLLIGNVLADNGFGADSDPDGDALSVAAMTVVTQQGVTVNITANGDFTYVAPPNFFGFDSFTYTVDDGNGGQETAVATIQVKLPAGATSGSGIDDTIIGTGAAEVFFGFEGADFIDGKGGNDVIYGGSLNGTDTVFGGGGNDVILGEGEGDNLSGEGGNDTIYGDGFGYETFVNGDDSIYGGGGDDTIYGGGGNDYIGGNGGADTLYGQDGDDLIQAGAGADTLYGGAGLDDLQGGGGNDIIYGDAGDDTLSGQGGDDTLYGGAGNDTMSGGAGADTLFGEAGDDTIDGNGGNDIIDAGEGNNTVRGGADDDTITAGSGNDYIEGNGGQDTIDAGNGNNTVTGGGDNDTITTGSGNDTILGNGGDDIINAGDGINTVTGGSGIDTITTGSGADTIEAKGGDDIIYAGAGDDIIQGNAGSDFLDGGLGADTLLGGADADVFDFNHTDAVDTATDFNLNHGPLNEGDVLDVSDLLTGFDPLSDTLSDWALITDNGADSFLSVDQDGAGTAFAMTQIAVLEGVTGLTDEDALVASGNLIV